MQSKVKTLIGDHIDWLQSRRKPCLVLGSALRFLSFHSWTIYYVRRHALSVIFQSCKFSYSLFDAHALSHHAFDVMVLYIINKIK